MPFFTIHTHAGEVFRFSMDRSSIRIGRSSESDLVLDDPTVSRLHAMVQRRHDGVYVLDLGSRSGTWLNGGAVEKPAQLEVGDSITVGTTELIYNARFQASVEFHETPLSSTANTTILSVEDVTPYQHEAPSSAAAREDPEILSFVLEADAELAIHRPLNDFFQRILGLARQAVPFDRGVILTLDGGNLVPRAQRLRAEQANRTVVISKSIATRAVQSNRAILVEDAMDDPDHRVSESVVSGRIRSAMCVPLWNNREVIGLLYVDNHAPKLFTQKGLRVLMHLAHIAAVKLEHKQLFDEAIEARALQDEMMRAAEIQNQFLPTTAPDIPGYRVHGFSRPCLAVGGDFYKYFEFSEGRYGIAMGDVAGHGLSAAMLMCYFQAMLSVLVDGPASPDEAVAQLNQALCRQIDVNRFITFFLGVIDSQQHTLTYVNAGQNCPFLIGPGGELCEFPPTGLPLGIMGEAVYGARVESLHPGSVFVGYSDGLTEMVDADGEEFGVGRVQSLASEVSHRPPEDIASHVLGAAEDYADDRPNADDVTLVVLRRVP